MGIIPAPVMEQPLLNDQSAQLGREFGQNARRLLAAPFIDVAVFLPEPEQPLHLPAEAGHDHHLWEGEQAARDIRQQDGPLRQIQAVFRRLAPMRLSIFRELFAPLVSPFFRPPHQDQAHGNPSGLAHQDSPLSRFSHLFGENSPSFQQGPVSQEQVRAMQQARASVPFDSCLPPHQALQTWEAKEAQICQREGTCRALAGLKRTGAIIASGVGQPRAIEVSTQHIPTHLQLDCSIADSAMASTSPPDD